MNSTTPKRHAETLRNRNIPFQLKNETPIETELTSHPSPRKSKN